MRTHRTRIVLVGVSVLVLALVRIALAAGPPPPPPAGSYLVAKFCGQVGDCDPWTSAEGESGQSGDPYYVALGETINFTDESVVMIPNPDGYHSGDPDYITKREWRVDDGDWTELPSGTTTWTWSPAQAGTYIVMERVSVSGWTSMICSMVVAVKSAVTVSVSPSLAYLSPGGTKQFTAKAKDENGNDLDSDEFDWSVTPGSLGSVNPPTGKSTTFTAGTTPGQGTVTAKHSPSNKEGSATVYIVKPQLKNGASIVSDGDFIYITATPQMPQLTARLKPDDLAGNVKWRLHVEYKRNRDDDDYYPGPGVGDWKTLEASASWDIASEFDTGIRGGRARLYCEYQTLTFDITFHIRGTNPTEAAAQTEIGEDPWYARPIARWESDEPSQGRYYAQFNTVGTLGAAPAHYKWCPNFGAPNGWGIMQLDNPNPTAEQLWNWKKNVAEGKSRLANPCRANAEAWIASQETQQQEEEPDKPLQNHVFTFNGVDYQKGTAKTPTDACTIQRYNGAALWVIYWKNKTETQPGSWETRDTHRAYVDNVSGEIE